MKNLLINLKIDRDYCKAVKEAEQMEHVEEFIIELVKQEVPKKEKKKRGKK